MGELSRLLNAANLANPANASVLIGPDSHDSHDSQTLGVLRGALRQAAIDEGLPLDVASELEDADVLACAGLPHEALRTYLCMVARRLSMAAGKVPPGWSGVTECSACGPVLLWNDPPAAVKGCGWCHHRKAGRAIPRPTGRGCDE